MIQTVDRSIAELRGRARLGAFLGEAARQLAAALLVLGSLALLLRLVFELEWRAAAPAFVPALFIPLTAYWRVRPSFLSEAGAAAWLDLLTGATGRLVTAHEVPDPLWLERANADLKTAPVVKLALRPAGLRLLGGLAFAALALLVPIPVRAIATPPNLHGGALEALREKLAALEEVVELEEEEALEVQATLERLDEEAATGADPEAVFEAIDQVTEQLEDEALEAAEAMDEVASEMAQIANGADGAIDQDAAEDALQAALEGLTAQGLDQGLSRSLEELGLSELGSELVEGLEGLQLDAAELAELATGLRELMEGELGKLANAGLLERGQLGAPGELAGLGDFKEHVCDDECEKGPGGT